MSCARSRTRACTGTATIPTPCGAASASCASPPRCARRKTRAPSTTSSASITPTSATSRPTPSAMPPCSTCWRRGRRDLGRRNDWRGRWRRLITSVLGQVQLTRLLVVDDVSTMRSCRDECPDLLGREAEPYGDHIGVDLAGGGVCALAVLAHDGNHGLRSQVVPVVAAPVVHAQRPAALPGPPPASLCTPATRRVGAGHEVTSSARWASELPRCSGGNGGHPHRSLMAGGTP